MEPTNREPPYYHLKERARLRRKRTEGGGGIPPPPIDRTSRHVMQAHSDRTVAEKYKPSMLAQNPSGGEKFG